MRAGDGVEADALELGADVLHRQGAAAGAGRAPLQQPVREEAQVRVDRLGRMRSSAAARAVSFIAP
jgi:hypothetical protein